jgi:hypothetical protein
MGHHSRLYLKSKSMILISDNLFKKRVYYFENIFRLCFLKWLVLMVEIQN